MHAFTPLFRITNRITAALTQIERARGFLEGAGLSESWIRETQNRAAMLEAFHTTRIEGTILTFNQAERLWNGERVPKARKDDVREFLNFRDALDFVSASLSDEAPITENMVRQIHAKLVSGVRGGSAAPGDYRRIQNYVVNSETGETVFTPPSAQDVPLMMSELVKWLNSDLEVHPVLASGIAQFQLVHIHPFLDGNGRTSRLLTTLYLYKHGYDFQQLFNISEYYDRDRGMFYATIQGVRDGGMDMTPWLEYFTEGLATQLLEVRTQGELALSIEQRLKEHGLNARQAAMLGYLTRNATLDIATCETLIPQVSRRTLQRDIGRLVELGILIQSGSTRLATYSMVLK